MDLDIIKRNKNMQKTGFHENVSYNSFALSPRHGHVAYQIKGNHICNNMVANILPAYPTLP